MNVEHLASRLGDESADLKHRCQAAIEIKDAIENIPPTALPRLLIRLLPIFLHILRGEPILVNPNQLNQTDKDAQRRVYQLMGTQKLRAFVLEIIHRLPPTPELLGAHAAEIFDLLMSLVENDNEENAVMAIKTLNEYHRVFCKNLGDRPQQFLNLMLRIFQQMPETVQRLVPPTDHPTQDITGRPGAQRSLDPSTSSPQSGPLLPSSDNRPQALELKPLIRGIESFKVIIECPIIVVSVLQAHRPLILQNIKAFIPSLEGALTAQAAPQKAMHDRAAERGEIYVDISPDIKDRNLFGDFIMAQVKTMSFLAYVVRIHHQLVQDFIEQLPEIVVRLLKDCPRERSSSRKELLVATRHIINYTNRKHFIKKIDELLDERVIIGQGLTVYETIRPLAYSMLADLIHHIRDSLAPAQIRTTIDVYTQHLLDDYPGTSFQTMSAKLLLNMADCIAKLENKAVARHYLMMILAAIAEKFSVMNRQFSVAVKISAQAEQAVVKQDQSQPSPVIDKFNSEYLDAGPIRTSGASDRPSDPVGDNKFLFKVLLQGLKNLVHGLRRCNPPAPTTVHGQQNPVAWSEFTFGFQAEEVMVIQKLFREGAKVFRYYGVKNKRVEPPVTSPLEVLRGHYMGHVEKEEKELLETFATVFHSIDPATFHEIFQAELPGLYKLVFEHSSMLHITQFFLASKNTSASFCGILLQFLMNHLAEVGSSDTAQSTVLLKLWKLSCMAVTLFSAENEPVLHPHVRAIINQAIELSRTAQMPINYFTLLRALFRSIGGGRFENLYKEILPLLEGLLEILNNLLVAARKPQERDLYVELCLTVPARLSNLLPHLNFLMKPLVVALQGGPDLVPQGLRTLELCVDNLTADYLDPIVHPVIDDLMFALWQHLRPIPYNHGHAHTTVRILGKLGGRNRRFLRHPPRLDFETYTDDRCSFSLRLKGSTKDRAFPAELAVKTAIERLTVRPRFGMEKTTDEHYQRQAFELVQKTIMIYLGNERLFGDVAQAVSSLGSEARQLKFEAATEHVGENLYGRSMAKKRHQEGVLKSLLHAVFCSTSLEHLTNTAAELLKQLAGHFALLEVGQTVASTRAAATLVEKDIYLDTKIWAEILAESLSSDDDKAREAACVVIRESWSAYGSILGSSENIERLGFLQNLVTILTHQCYSQEWYLKSGASNGILLLLDEKQLPIPVQWFIERQIELSRALIFIIKDVPQDIPFITRDQAKNALLQLLRRCTTVATEEKDQTSASKFHSLASMLMHETSSANAAVREIAQKALQLLAELTGQTMQALVVPVKDRLLKSIFGKPLRALPFASQIGYIEAVYFCIELDRDLVPMGDEFKRLLYEALALADADDDVLANRVHEQRPSESIVNLKVSCIKLLSMVLCYPELSSEGLEVARTRVMNMFFKSLYSRQTEVSDAAYEGLKKLLAQSSKLPQHLLKNGLRPILMNLSDPRKLNPAGLDGLARLLAILPNYFKVEIGTRLLDHLTRFRDKDMLQVSSLKLLEQTQHAKIIAAILHVFRLLPPAGVQFLEKLVDNVLYIEDGLRRTNGSPFRDPLIKFLSRYSQEAWNFFADRLQMMRFGRLFSQLLPSPLAGPLREAVKVDPQGRLLSALRDHLDIPEANDVSNVSAISILFSLSASGDKDLSMVADPAIRAKLLAAGERLHRRSRTQSPPEAALRPEFELAAQQSEAKVLELHMLHMQAHPEDLDCLFSVIQSVSLNSIDNSHHLLQFINDQVIRSTNIDYQRSIIERALALNLDPGVGQKTKTFLLHHLVNPILEKNDSDDGVAVKSGSRLMDEQLSNQIVEIWRVNIGVMSDGPFSSGIDHTRLEILQLTAIVLKCYSADFYPHRKQIIQLGYSFNKLEDIVNKYAAYVVIAFFITKYECPPDLVMSNYNALLKAYQSEGRSLVSQALDLIAQTLSDKRFNDKDVSLPKWATLLHKIVREEGYNLQQLMSIFNFVVRHPDLFYDMRDHFIKRIVQSLQKIAPAQTASNENRKLVLRLIDLIYKWECMRIDRRDQVERPDERQEEIVVQSTQEIGDIIPMSRQVEHGEIHPNLRRSILTYLVQMICALADRFPLASDGQAAGTSPTTSNMQPEKMCRRAVQLFYELLGERLWGDLDVDLYPNIIRRILERQWTTTEELASMTLEQKQEEEKLMNRSINALVVLTIVLNTKSNEWIVSNLQDIEVMLTKALRSNNAKIQECLHEVDASSWQSRPLQPLLGRILDAAHIAEEPASVDETEPEPTSSPFATFLSDIVAESLAVNDFVAGINILWTLSHQRPAEIDRHFSVFNKSLTQLAREYVQQVNPGGPGMAERGSRTDQPNNDIIKPNTDTKVTVALLMKAIEIMPQRMAALGEQRRPFLSCLASLVEKSPDLDLCTKILDMVENWTLTAPTAVPTVKEKTAVLHKMLTFETRVDKTMLNKFLDLIARIYEDPEVMKTELTVRLEHCFLVGTRAENVQVRARFIRIFDDSLTRTFSTRLNYLLTIQSWDNLNESYWIAQINELMLKCTDEQASLRLHPDDFTLPPLSLYYNEEAGQDSPDSIVDDKLESFVQDQQRFMHASASIRVKQLLDPMCQLQHVDFHLGSQIWTSFFPLCWSALSRDERSDLEKGLLALITKEWHHRQIDRRPNVIQTLLESIAKTSPPAKMPPHVLKFMGRTYEAWYTTLHMLESAVIEPTVDLPAIRESTLDALLETYAGLQENDLYYGTWRRRCAYMETNAGLSYEQVGMWDRAQEKYELAQVKARSGAMPFSQSEYALWEDHWVICAQKLQHWEILGEFAKHENLNDLFLEATWRQHDMWTNQETRDTLDTIIKGLMDAPTQRRSFFTAYMALLKVHQNNEPIDHFRESCDSATQLALKKWHQLPKRLTNAHVPILQQFQQIVELQDASIICQALSQTTTASLEQKSSELKLLLGTWRDRLPNPWDDIEAWQDLVTWRQQIFHLVNKAYLPLLPSTQPGPNVPGHSFACRGYHETAWIINKFAHVARKHEMPEICIAQLSKIYTLPNIEIQDAFLKLTEQAKCHYQNPNELSSGLDVINNTNLSYFAGPQKAEFFALKGMFYAKIGDNRQDADEAFGTALQFDIKFAKAWSQWGVYNDNLFKQNPADFHLAAGAVSCYLEATAILKSGKARKLLSRVLWLLSVDSSGEVMTAFDLHRGDPSPSAAWYWVTFIPQLLVSLSQPEARQCHNILSQIAQQYPQALFFQLRTSREDFAQIKKSQYSQAISVKMQQANAAGKSSSSNSSQMSPTRRESGPGSQANSDSTQVPHPANASPPASAVNGAHQQASPQPAQNGGGAAQANGHRPSSSTNGVSNGDAMDIDPVRPASNERRQPWEYADELMGALKSAFPLLALSMETMVDQINKYFKSPPDEDAYRLIVALLNDGISYVNRTPNSLADEAKLPPATEANITRFAETILPSHHRAAFEADFVTTMPNLPTYIEKLVKWRDMFEERLDRRRRSDGLEKVSPHLAEFKFQKFDDVDVPGQYLQLEDSNKDFVKIERIMPDIDLVRGVNACYRRLRLRGHDGSIQTFAVQNPAARQCRREERILQLFRTFNGVLEKKKESRKRNLFFHLPVMIPLNPHIRLIADDTSYISLQSLYEDHCRRTGRSRDEPILFTIRNLKRSSSSDLSTQQQAEQLAGIKLETMNAIQESMVPKTVALDYFAKTYPSFQDFWLFRRQFSYQYAAVTFLTYVMHINNRYPHKLSIARSTGNLWAAELTSALAAGRAVFHNPEPVNFRLTPNIQRLMGPMFMEGIYSPSLMTIARCITQAEGRLEHQLSIFVRDEMMFWHTQQHRPPPEAAVLRDMVEKNSISIVHRAVALARIPRDLGNLPANVGVIDYISQAVNPANLSQCDALWMPYL